MELFLLITVTVCSLALIVKGGDIFITSAVWIAHRTRMPQVLIGATVVSIGTTLPEISVSVMSAAAGDYPLSLSNAAGSMLCNISVVIGISLVLADSVIDTKKFRFKFIILFASLAFLFVSLADGTLSATESTAMLCLFLFYFISSIMEARSEYLSSPAPTMEYLRAKQANPTLMLAMFAGGLICIFGGAYLLVSNTERLVTDYMGVSTAVAGVTFIALASALPELITVIAAVKKKAAAISLGNVIGANIINSTLLTGIAGLISGGADIAVGDAAALKLGGISTATLGAGACIIALILLTVPLMAKGKTSKTQGYALVSVYAVYILFIILLAAGAL